MDFAALQSAMAERLALDRSVKSVEVKGITITDALAQAAVLLGISARHLEYEVLKRGSGGFMGLGKEDWMLRAYPVAQALREQAEVANAASSLEAAVGVEAVQSVNGKAFVHGFDDGFIYLKVIPPQGDGKSISVHDVMKEIDPWAPKDIDDKLINKTVGEAAGTYVKVASYVHNPAQDCSALVNIDNSEMKATVTLTRAGTGGCHLSEDRINTILSSNGVRFGIMDDAVEALADEPVYGEAVLCAQGENPQNGKDAYIQYDFETDNKKRYRQAENGQVDFRETNLIQNAVQGQPLARKIAAEHGQSGTTVTGKVTEAKDGKDCSMPVGKNVHLSDDGSSIIADLDGQVVMAAGKINIETVMNVSGNVDMNTGNIIFLGTVNISGNVEDGFSVKAEGNIEINGNVGQAQLEAEGDVILHQGASGKGKASIKAGGNVFAKFIESCNVEAGDTVIVSEGIISSNVSATKRIICNGKRARVVGGHLRASEEINAKTIGSPEGGAQTICEVGYEPKSKVRLEELSNLNAAEQKDYDQVQLELSNLIKAREQRGSLPEDKEEQMAELMEKRDELTIKLKQYKEERQQIQQYLEQLRTLGRVSASEKIYPGVHIIVREIGYSVQDEAKSVTYSLQENHVRAGVYEELAPDAIKTPAATAGVDDGPAAG
jgi:uncharacterized protein (DUF342 family)